MNNLYKLIAFALLLFMQFWAKQTYAQNPRLFINPSRLNQIKAAIQVPSTHHNEAYTALKNRVDKNDWKVYDDNLTDGNWNYARSYMAREAAFMYIITGDTKYAQMAYRVLEMVHQDPDPDKRLPESASSGLARAMVGLGFAFAYDWAYDGLTQPQRDYLADKIKITLDAWPKYVHTNLSNPNRASNWVAVCNGGELVLMLAAKQETQRAARYAVLKQNLNTHMGNAYGTNGVMQEGLGYNSYACAFLIPAVLAAKSIGDTGFDQKFDTINWWKLAMYAFSFAPDRKFIMSGVSERSMPWEGWASLLLQTVPIAQKPYYTYFYDRHMGKLATKSPSEKYDPERAGTVWALLYYPEMLEAKDPMPSLGMSMNDDKKGAFYFRNRWQDENDVQIALQGDFDHHNNAWDQPEGFQLGLVAYNTRFIGGPAKRTTANVYSSLLVDGKAYLKSTDVCAPVYFKPSPQGGYVQVNGGMKYVNLGLTNAYRHILTDFAAPLGTDAIISTLDKTEAKENHTYSWQINLGDDSTNGGVTPTQGVENGHPYFLLKGNNNGYVKGWVINAKDAVLKAGDPLTISVTGKDVNMWVAMLVGRGMPPEAVFTGSDLETAMYINKKRLRYDANIDQIVYDSVAEMPLSVQKPLINNTSFLVYPNPLAGHVLHMEIPGFINMPAHVQLFNAWGASCLDQTLILNNTPLTLDLPSLPAGIYQLMVTAQGRRYSKQLVIK